VELVLWQNGRWESTCCSSVSICGRVDYMNAEHFLSGIYGEASGAGQELLGWI